MNNCETRSIIFYDGAKIVVVYVERMKIERTEIIFDRQFRVHVESK